MKKRYGKILIVVALVVVLMGGVSFFLSAYSEIYDGQLAVIGGDKTGNTSIYLLYPYINYFEPITPTDVTPFFMAWSPRGKTIAFVFSTSGAKKEGGIALLDVQKKQLEKIYIFPNDQSYYNLLAWESDAQTILFDVYKGGYLIGFQKMDTKTKSTTFLQVPQKMQSWTHINSFYVIALEQIVVENDGYIYLVSKDMQKVELISKGTNLSLMPDGEKVSFYCRKQQLGLCDFEIKSRIENKISDGSFMSGVGANTNWSRDARYFVYLKVAGESDPHYILMFDTVNKKTYQVYKGAWHDDIIINQISWFSGKTNH